MSTPTLRAHSLAEIDLYFMATSCACCERGLLKCEGRRPTPDDSRPGVVAEVGCENCGHESVLTFSLSADAPASDGHDLYPVINPTDQPSEILDVGQWIVLFRVILEAAAKEENKIEVRRLGYEAAQCLEEALKFYADDDLPPPDAIFCDVTLRRRRDHPEQFSKQHLLDLRAKLPALTTMQRQIVRWPHGKPTPRRTWWKFWSQ